MHAQFCQKLELSLLLQELLVVTRKQAAASTGLARLREVRLSQPRIGIRFGHCLKIVFCYEIHSQKMIKTVTSLKWLLPCHRIVGQ
ncbi:hypothetical protein CJF35_02345 [Pseudomonas lundensis]|nr:hypothetical protein CJF35_02345 [Pseudomonas lundensis]